MHPLLARQLKRILGEALTDTASLPSPWREFVNVVEQAYQEADSDRELAERSMEVASQEVVERNQQLTLKNKELEKADQALRRSHEELEQRVAERTAELRAAMEQAESASRAKSAFLANMSHEIRTPMTAILGYADMLLSSNQSDDQRLENVQTIRRQGEHLLSILNDILDLSKIEADKLAVERIVCDPAQIVSEAVSLMRVRAIEKNLFCEVTYAGPIPQTIQTDPTRLRQILLNLIGNAIKFTQSGGIQIIVGLDQPAGMSVQWLKIDVIDSGIGMSAGQVATLFKPFEQGDGSMTRKFGGTGLGLYISKRLAEMLGGSIAVQSLPNAGSRFTITVETGNLSDVKLLFRPHEVANGAGMEPPPSTQKARAATPQKQTGRILVAEDGLHNQRVFRFYLEAAGFDVTVVDNGRLGYERAVQEQEAGTPFDAILMDMQMPEMDGYTAATRLRGCGYAGPIIAATAHAMAGDRDRCTAAGCSDYVTKPIDRDKLIETVSRAVSGSKALSLEGKSVMTSIVPTGVIDPDFAKFLPDFIADLSLKVEKIIAASRDNDADALRRILHDIKGTAGSFGFPQITALAQETEARLIQNSEIKPVENDVASLVKLIQSVEGFKPARASGKIHVA